MQPTALIAGVTGIVGNNLATHLASKGWAVHGIARRPNPIDPSEPNIHPIAADLLDPAALQSAIAHLAPTQVFITTWMRQATETENCRVNGALVRNLLQAIRPDNLQRMTLVTGLKHYLGPFDNYAKAKPQTPFREEMPRVPGENFYYTQEDELFDASRRLNVAWNVHRPHTIIGFALGNAMNMGVTLAVHASICRELGKPFLFPGSPQQWEGLSDVTDARLLARHLEWSATTLAARNQAFNSVNGDIFRWNWLWPKLAAHFHLEVAPYPGHPTLFEGQMANFAPIWSAMAKKYNLAEPDITKLISPWHTDLDLGRPMEVMTDITKSRKLGFLDYQSTPDTFIDLFNTLCVRRIIPA